jgi:6-phosphogluconolactonase
VTGQRQVEVFESIDLLAARGTDLFLGVARESISLRNKFRVALSGGSSPVPLFRHLATEARISRMDWEKVEFFWADERCVPPDNPDSNFRLADELLLSALPAPGAVVHRIPGELPPDEAARACETDLARSFPGAGYPVFDLILLGVGDDGHTASLFPQADLAEHTGRTAIAVYVEKLRSHRVTLTLPVINSSRQVVFFVTGAPKAVIIAEILAGEGNKKYPAALVEPRDGNLTWLLDAEAAAGLNLRVESAERT